MNIKFVVPLPLLYRAVPSTAPVSSLIDGVPTTVIATAASISILIGNPAVESGPHQPFTLSAVADRIQGRLPSSISRVEAVSYSLLFPAASKTSALMPIVLPSAAIQELLKVANSSIPYGAALRSWTPP